MTNRRFTSFLLVVILSVSALTTDSLSVELKKSEPLVIDGKADLTISGLEIANPQGNGITIKNSKRIRVEGCKIGPCKGEAVNIYACEGVTVTGNRFEAVSTGVYALDSRQIEVTHNRCLNVHGPFPRGQLAQFDKVTGGGNRINHNLASEHPGQEQSRGCHQHLQVQRHGGRPHPGHREQDPGRRTERFGRRHHDRRWRRRLHRGEGQRSGRSGSVRDRHRGRSSYTNIGQQGLRKAAAVHERRHLRVEPVQGSQPRSHGRGNQVRWFNKGGMENPCWDAKNCGTIAGWDDNNWHADLDDRLLPTDLLGKP